MERRINKLIGVFNPQFRSFAYTLLSLGILSIGYSIRVLNLEQFPIQADEATGAYFVAQSQEGSYAYNPQHFHGPTLIYLGNMITTLFEEDSWSKLTQKTLRRIPVFSSLGILIIILAHRKALGVGACLIAGSLVAASPFLVYYNRIFIHETLLAFFLSVSLAVLYQFRDTINHRKSTVLGMFLGISVATKETFVITVFAWLLVGVFLGIGRKFLVKKDYLYLLTIAFSFIGSAGFLSTNFGSDWDRFFDFITTYWKYQTTEGHHQPFYHYFTQFALPTINRGLFWWEGFVFWLSLLTCFTKRKENLVGHFFFFAGFLQIIIYSLISYKVPWLMLVPWLHLTIATALSLSIFGKKYHWSLVLLLLVITLFCYFYQSWRIVTEYHSDTRNPFAYVPTSKSIVEWEKRITQDFSGSINLLSPEQKSYVIGTDYWPLPWYLRKLEPITYTANTPTMVALKKAPIVIGIGKACDQIIPLIRKTHYLRFQGLREGVTLRVLIKKDIYDEADSSQ